VVIGGDAVIARNLGKLPDIIQIVAADVDIEKYVVSVLILLLDQVVEIGANRG